MQHYKYLILSVLALGISACSKMVPPPLPPSPAHLQGEKAVPAEDIPNVVEQTPILPPPEAIPSPEKYTVVVNEVPVKELLFALARDAKMNIDVDPSIQGVVTLNAVQQTLTQILERVARQVDIRYEIQNKTIIIMPDKPYFRTYKIDYVNMSRDSTANISVATQVATAGRGVTTDGGGGGSTGTAGNNNSTASITDTSNHRFWLTITRNVQAIISASNTISGNPGEIPVTDTVIPNPESGTLSVKATAKQHQAIQTFIDQALTNALRQVLIEITVVEVSLNDQYKAGIDWALVRLNNKQIEGGQNLGAINANNNIDTSSLGFITRRSAEPNVPPIPGVANSFVLNYLVPGLGNNALNFTLQLLRQFGDTKVLSSPRLMALNNQTAVLKVVENKVYFEVRARPGAILTGIGGTSQAGNVGFDTIARTVPVGLVMTVTPQISENEQVTLNVRPTISSQSGDVLDPNPALTRSSGLGGTVPIDNRIPVIQVSEMESMLKLNDGQIAVLGGLMQDRILKSTVSVPVLSDLPLVGDTVFKSRRSTSIKTELVVFIRPIIIKNPSIEGDLKDYRPYLEHQQPYYETPNKYLRGNPE